MGATEKTIGGSRSGKALSEDFVSMLSQLMNTGGVGAGSPMGAGAMGQTAGGMAGILGDILSPGAGNVGGSLATLLQRSQERNVNNLRSRFGASGGMGFGTPAAYAESLYRAEAAPQIATQIGQLQMSAISPLLQSMMSIYGTNTPQAQTVMQPGIAGQIAGTLGQFAPIAANFLAPGLGSALPPAPRLPGIDLSGVSQVPYGG